MLKSFTAEAAGRLAAEVTRGAEVPFELVAEPGAEAPLYWYRPLTARFIEAHLAAVGELHSYGQAVRALAGLENLGEYLGASAQAMLWDEARGREPDALLAFLDRVFGQSSDFGFDDGRFEAAYAEFEFAVYEGRRTTTVIAPVLGLALEYGTRELVVGAGLSLVRGDAVPGAPYEAVRGERQEPHVLALLTVFEEGPLRPALADVRAGFSRLLTALRLCARGTFALGPLAWACTDGGTWRPVAVGAGGDPRSITFISSAHEDDLRAFVALVARRVASRAPRAWPADGAAPESPASGVVAWALARYEMGSEQLTPAESLSDYLLALRALLEPEGPDSGRLPGRLGALCGPAEERIEVTHRVAAAVALERDLMRGASAVRPAQEALIAEVAERLRVVLVDALCGHVGPDLCGVADELLAQAAAPAP